MTNDQMQERKDEANQEALLYSDEEYCLEQLVEDELSTIHDKLQELTHKMANYGWTVEMRDLIQKLKEI